MTQWLNVASYQILSKFNVQIVYLSNMMHSSLIAKEVYLLLSPNALLKLHTLHEKSVLNLHTVANNELNYLAEVKVWRKCRILSVALATKQRGEKQVKKIPAKEIPVTCFTEKIDWPAKEFWPWCFADLQQHAVYRLYDKHLFIISNNAVKSTEICHSVVQGCIFRISDWPHNDIIIYYCISFIFALKLIILSVVFWISEAVWKTTMNKNINTTPKIYKHLKYLWFKHCEQQFKHNMQQQGTFITKNISWDTSYSE